MAKKVVGMIKLQITAGQANPSPPVGPALGQKPGSFIKLYFMIICSISESIKNKSTDLLC